MYCPRCSQEQISAQIKYCSRCGFLLTDIAEALENEGLIKRNVIYSARDLKMATLGGVGLMTFSGIFVLLTLIFWTPEPSYFVQFNLLIGLLLFLFGMGFIAFSFWIKPKLLEKGEQNSNQKTKIMEPATSTKLLNEEMLPNIPDYSPPKSNLKTKDLVKIPTVTEETTKFL